MASEEGDGRVGPRVLAVPEGDNRARRLCPECGFIQYRNPVVVVGSVCRAGDGRLLLCRRAIAPRIGFWTIPAGYLELGETTRDGACREAEEEANVEIAIDQLLAVYDIAHIGQVQVIFAARLLSEAPSPGIESLEVRLFAWDDLPWDELAFDSVGWALRHHRQALETGNWMPRAAPDDDMG